MKSIRNRMTRGWLGMFMVLAVMLMAVACSRKSPQDLLKEARAMLANRDMYGAELMYQKVVDQYPDTEPAIEARLGLVECYRLTKNNEAAFEQLDQLLKVFGGPESMQGYNMVMLKVQLLGEEKKYGDAIKMVEETSRTLKTSTPERHAHLASVLGRLYLFDKQNAKACALAIRLFDQVKGNPKLHPDALTLLENVFAAEKDKTPLIKIYRQYVQLFPNGELTPNVLLNIGLAEKGMGRAEEAKKDFAQSVDVIKGQLAKTKDANVKAGMSMKLAQVYQLSGDSGKSRQELELIQKENSSKEIGALAMLALASIDQSEGHRDAAIKRLKQVAEQYPNTREQRQAMIGIKMLSQAGPTTGTTTAAPAPAKTGAAEATPTPAPAAEKKKAVR